MVSCERPMPTDTTKRIDGYRIEGKVTDRFKRPVASVEVRLVYYFNFVDTEPPPSRGIVVVQNSTLVTVRVFSLADQPLWTLFQRNVAAGDFEYLWDGKDGLGNIVPSGIYKVKYIVGSADTANTYTLAITGGKVATSNSEGVYQIDQERLPVGFAPVPLYLDNGTFDANYQVDSRVRLEFVFEGFLFPFVFDLEKNVVTDGSVSLN